MPQSRRSFLSALAGVPLALAPVAVVPKAPAGSSPAPRNVERHDAALAATDECDCYACRTARRNRGSHPAHVASVIALRAADRALGRLAREYRGKWQHDVRADADGVGFPIQVAAASLDGELYTTDDFDQREAAAVAAADHGPATDAALLALYDCLDSLLDLVDGHCDSWTCHVCADADRTVYHVAGALNLIGQCVLTTPAVAARAVLSAERKVARNVDPDTVHLHTARESYDPESELSHARTILAIVQEKEASRGATTL